MKDFMAISLRVPPEVKKKVARLAEAQDTTSHAFMLEAIREKVEAEEERAAFHAEARQRLARMKKAGLGIPAEEVLAYLRERAHGGTPARPKPRKFA
jgi:predicted transcriptional regulator